MTDSGPHQPYERSAARPTHRLAPGDGILRPGDADRFDTDFDGGLTRERTYLAWSRTALAIAAYAAVAGRFLDEAPAGLRWGVVGYALLLAGAAWMAANHRYEQTFWELMHARRRTPRGLRALSLGIALLGAASGVAILLS